MPTSDYSRRTTTTPGTAQRRPSLHRRCRATDENCLPRVLRAREETELYAPALWRSPEQGEESFMGH